MRQTIEMEIGGSRLIVSGDNLSITGGKVSVVDWYAREAAE